MLRVEVVGADETARALARAADDLRPGLLHAAAAVHRQATPPRRTGHLAASGATVATGPDVGVTWAAPYAAAVWARRPWSTRTRDEQVALAALDAHLTRTLSRL